MAAQQNQQGLFIAVILLVLLSVVLAVATFFGFSGMREVADQSAGYKENLEAEKSSREAFQAQAGILKAYLGFEGATMAMVQEWNSTVMTSGDQTLIDETNDITAEYDKDMAKYTSEPDGTDLNYKKLVDDLATVVNEKHTAWTVLDNTIREVELEKEREIAAKDKELAEKETQLQKSIADLTEERSRHEQSITEYSQQLDDTEQKFKTASQDHSDAVENLRTATAKYKDDIDDLKSVNLKQEAMIASLTAQETNVADGQIVSVAPGLGRVVINLGSEDNLRLKQTFAVYDQSVNNYKSGEGKAMIEVTRIYDAHLAEARITSQDIINPILHRDFVVTSTWDPGYTVPVAIVGRIDLDGDGQSDLQRLISVVEQNGGKVVAYHDEEGNVFGEIDENTRFFVKGKDPLGAMHDGFNRLDIQRERFQTREISVQEFVNEMGYRSEAKIQRFDDSIPRGTFKPRQPGGTSITTGSPFGDSDK